jgi:hypothetical protein
LKRDKVNAGSTETLPDTPAHGSEPDAADILDTSRRQMPPSSHVPLVGGHDLLGPGMQLVQGRFRIGREIGQGGTGIVYEAWDADRAEKMALKTLSRLSAAGIYGLKNEFRALPHVTHANLVRLHELFAEDEQWFFTMDLIEGEPFDRWVRPNDALDELRLRSGLRQLLDAMSAIHGAGKLHRDLKPSNVLVTAEGRLFVLDFGLTSDWQPESIGQTMADNVVSGTPAYMAPEQAAGMPATPASDYYALGVMLFEALTGSLPFPGEKRQVLEAKQRQAAPWPRATTGDLPEDLVSLCVQLLSRDPTARPQGAAVKAAIGADDHFVAAAAAPTAGSEHRTIGFIGRQAELLALRSAYQTTLSGAPALVVVSGESGIGKTALCEAFLEESRGGGHALVFAGRCYERERVPFNAFDVLIDEISRYLRRLPAEQAIALLPEDAFALARLFPVLNRVDVIAEAPIRHIPEPNELRRRAFGALGELFGRLRDRHPLTLFIDDAQWLDHDSAVLFRHLLIQRTIVPLLVVVGQRSSAEESLKLVEWVLDAARSNHKWTVHTLPLGPLPADTSHALALRLLTTGTANDPVTVEGLAQTIAHESRGSPFFAGELARFALRDGPAKLGGLSLSGVLDARLDSLPVSARRILQVLALAGQPLPLEVVCDAGAASHSDLDALRAAHLVRRSESATAKSIACYHDQIRENVCAGLSEAQCQGHWGRLSESLSRRDDADQELLSRCFEGVGNRQAAAHCAALAADRAATALAFDHSATLYRKSLDLGTPVGVDRLAVLVKLADALASSGRGQEAAEVYQDAARLTADNQSIELRRRAAEQLLCTGNAAAGTMLVRAVCDEVGVTLPSSVGAALLSIVWGTVRTRRRGLDVTPRHPAPGSAADTLRLRVAHTAATGLAGYLPMHSASLAGKYLLDALAVGDPLHLVQALGFNAYAHCQLQPRGSWAAKLLARMEAVAEQDGRPELLGFTRLIAGTVAFYGNSFREARADLARARTILQRCHGVAWELDSANFHDQFSAHYCGDYADIARTTPSLIDEALRRGRVFAGVTLSGFGGAPAWLTPDDPDGYRRQIAEAKRFWLPSAVPQFPDYLLLMGEIMLSLYADQPASGFDRLEMQRSAYMRTMLLRRSTTTQTRFAALSGYCAAAAIRASPHGTGSRDVWFAAARRSSITLRRLRTQISLALAEVLNAALALGVGDRDQAAERLRDSVKRLDAADLGMHAAAARRRLGQLLGGDEGRALLATGDSFMQAQNVTNREAITELCCPGCRT